MKFNELKARSVTKPLRAGRGVAAGRGKTAGRGTKGQGSRKSGGVRPGFEGGQMPIYMQLPHLRGFKSHRRKVETVFTGQLESLKTVIDSKTLFEASLISSPFARVKLLVNGVLRSKKHVKLHFASRSAVEVLQKTGGGFISVDQVARQANVTKKSK